MILKDLEKGITVEDLIKKLKEFPPGMKVVTQLHSDLYYLAEPVIIEVIPKSTGLERYYKYHWRNEKKPTNLIKVVYFAGN